MAGVYEMLWDCAFCGTRKLLGKTHRHCPACGAPQDPARRYFPSDDEKVAVKDHVFVGVDRVCPACGAPGSRAAAHCGGCGAALDGGKDVALKTDGPAAPAAAAAAPSPPPPRRGRRIAIAGAVAA